MVNGSNEILTDIIVPVLDNLELTKIFIDSALKQKNTHIIVIDNGSREQTKEYLESLLPAITLIRNENNLGYVKAINQGLDKSNAPTILLANNDTYLPIDLISLLRSHLNAFDIVSPLSNNIGDTNDVRLINYPYGSYEYADKFADNLYINNITPTEVDYVFGHCMLIKSEVFKSLGYLDERFGIGNYDDVDYCRRATKRGFKIGIINNLFVYHQCHATFDALEIDVNKLIKDNKTVFDKKWHENL